MIEGIVISDVDGRRFYIKTLDVVGVVGDDLVTENVIVRGQGHLAPIVIDLLERLK